MCVQSEILLDKSEWESKKPNYYSIFIERIN